MIKKFIPYLVVIFSFTIASCGGGREIVVVKPPPPEYVVPVSPGAGYTWMYGYWVRRGRHTVWVPGYWQSPDGFKPTRERRR